LLTFPPSTAMFRASLMLLLAAALLVLVVLKPSSAVELTFELPDNAKECFFEQIEEGTEATLEFQVEIKVFLKN